MENGEEVTMNYERIHSIKEQASQLVEKIEPSKEYRRLIAHARHVLTERTKTQLSHIEQLPRSAPRFGEIKMWVKRQTGKDTEPWNQVRDGKLFGQRLVEFLEGVEDELRRMEDRDMAYDVLMEATRLLLRDLRSEVLFSLAVDRKS